MIVEKTSSSILLSSGILNVTHYKSHEHPEQLNIKEIYNIEITLSGVCIYLPSSCRLRLSLSTSDWPIIIDDNGSIEYPNRLIFDEMSENQSSIKIDIKTNSIMFTKESPSRYHIQH
ncbi:unnamed protein product [Rotaria sp. Silwood2]|nr:unnamed protein product [Rotaria sp. Silwood2]